jgi:hypothetical protein
LDNTVDVDDDAVRLALVVVAAARMGAAAIVSGIIDESDGTVLVDAIVVDKRRC